LGDADIGEGERLQRIIERSMQVEVGDRGASTLEMGLRIELGVTSRIAHEK
jgi:hypothetical protein